MTFDDYILNKWTYLTLKNKEHNTSETTKSVVKTCTQKLNTIKLIINYFELKL